MSYDFNAGDEIKATKRKSRASSSNRGKFKERIDQNRKKAKERSGRFKPKKIEQVKKEDKKGED